ncbi:MAG: molybdopterin cofactor-binding domain-containing protein, partial [Phenylobacterium sp.]
GRAAAAALSPWIEIGPDGSVTLTCTALEMGQGSRTGQAQILADELDAAWDSITARQAPEAEPFLMDGALYSGGSETVRTRFDLLRRAGATARAQLVAAAAKRWGVAASECDATLGKVRHEPSGRTLGYGELAAEAAALPPPKDSPLKPTSARRYIGKPLSTLAQDDKVTGRARFGLDVELPGMLRASIRQCPAFGGTLAEVDEAPALAVRGVREVVRLKNAVAVVADTTWAAIKGVRALQPRWTSPALALDSAEIGRRLEAAQNGPGAMIRPEQDGTQIRAALRQGFEAAPRKVEATYELAYLSHSPIEPMNAVARVTADKVEIWAPCQAPTWLREEVATATGRPKAQIVVHPLLMGGGFGRRLKGDYAALAALVAEQVDAPVQLVWTREEDLAHDFYRPACRMTFRAGLEADGGLSGYEAVLATADDVTGGSGPKPYAIPRFAATLSQVACGVPIGSWRSVDPGMTLFGRESFIDECAAAAGADPLAYRERLLGDDVRVLKVLRAAAEAIGWTTPRAPGVGRGLALLHGWDTVVAHAVEVKVEGDHLRVLCIVAAADPGTIVNPQQVRAQFEGGALMGLSAALGEAVTIKDGAAEQTSFTSYPLLRINQAPQVEVILLESPDAPVGGCGEPPVPGVAPALANAVFQATGRRVRALPFAAQGFAV